MGKIKSALEIALERTESVKSDKGSIGQFEARQKGKKLANDFLAGSIKSLEEEINKTAKDEQENLRQGVFDILITRISLPNTKEEIQLIEAAGKGLLAVIKDKRFGEVVKELPKIMNQYSQEAAQYEAAIKQQYAPKLRQKEEEIARRLGREVKLDPFQDPEFVAFFNQHMNALKSNYQAVLDDIREEATRLFGEKN